ncbi:MAG: C25 family cysteine peptidase [Pirellulales bacterium]
MSHIRFIVIALFLVAYFVAAAAAAPDTLVVCPMEFRAALRPWESCRREQGHELSIVEPTTTARELHGKIQEVAREGNLKTVVLIGDVPTVPTGYAEAKVNIHWGSEPTIATDQLYADVDGDGSPDVAVGRIPADTPEELTAVVRKVLRYEQRADHGSWRRQIDVVAGTGGFGPLTDALIEGAARSVFQQVVPSSYSIRQLKADPDETCAQISAGSFAWIYLGHGLPSMLDVADTPHGPRPILATGDVSRLRCGANSPLAVLIACYTGAIDARDDSLAEELVLDEQGPIAVIAATRVTMPYGNTVLGCELLRATFTDRAATLGEVWMRAQQHTLVSAPPNDSLRTSIDALARGVSPPPVDLAAERREHVLLYQLLGDPLLRLNYPRAEGQAPARIASSPQTGSVK